ncbi:MAG: transporter [Mesorhizobium amorphae]|nr:MAG: transporter [Mesorhizobium amorphae]
MASLLDTVLFVFGLVGLGTIAAGSGYLSAKVGEGLTEFAVGVALPLLLFRTMVSADFGEGVPWAFWAAYFTAVAVAWTVGHLITTRLFGQSSAAGVVGGVSAAFSNLLLLGIPFIGGVLGQQAFEALSLILAIHLPIMLFASVILFQLFGRGEGKVSVATALRQFFGRLARNPLIVGIALGTLWRVSGLPLPGFLDRLVGALAGIAGPVALFAVGFSLVRYGILGNLRHAALLAAVKLVLMPAVALAAALLFGLPPLLVKVVVCAAGLPAGVNSYLIATQFGTGQGLASNAMTLSTALAVLSTSFWLLVLQHVVG